ncbi:hypothetical protein MMC25_005308 [Agyrium rufum]|nr:hypothetical protein [Agyrium rufum]
MEEPVSLEAKLAKIKSPKLQNQRETGIVLSAIEDTLKDQKHEFSPTAYFAALLALLAQAIPSSKQIVNKELASSVVYLLDTITPHVPAPILRSKFPQILTSIAPALTFHDAEAPLLRSSMGCLESLILAQDAAAWTLPQTNMGPRRAVVGLLTLATDHRPKVRKRAQEALTKILQNPPPSPSLDHPVADMCAEAALRQLSEAAQASNKKGKGRNVSQDEHHPGLIHALHLVKTIASAARGWPSKKIDALCEVLLDISKSTSEYLTMAAFEAFEVIFAGMINETSSAKLPRLLEAISELQPSSNDTQLLPPWIAVISRGYEVSAQLDADDTFQKLPIIFEKISTFLTSMSHNIRISTSECLISLFANCVPSTAILEPSIYDEKVLEKLSRLVINLLSVKYQAAWIEVFQVISAAYETLKWNASPSLDEALRTVADLRGSDSFNGKKEADAVLGKAIEAVGPSVVLKIAPLNLTNPRPGQPGRAWLLPILREHVINTDLMHFRNEFVPLSEMIFQRIINHGDAEKTMEVKIFETLVQQTWALLPGYCNLPTDLTVALDQSFAELLSNLLYQQPELRPEICKALQILVESNKDLLAAEDPDESPFLYSRLTKADAQNNIDHLTGLAGNLLAVLFNVYSQTLPHFRAYILQCINAYLSITPEKEISETFDRVTSMLEASLADLPTELKAVKQQQIEKAKKKGAPPMPPTSHTLMDLTITLALYLPISTYPSLLTLASHTLPLSTSPQLQKKAYKLFPRLLQSPYGPTALSSRSTDLQTLLLQTAESATPPCKRDRLAAIGVVVETLPPNESLHFIPAVLSEVVLATKEVNEKARTQAFDLLIQMSKKLDDASQSGGMIAQSRIPHMPSDAPDSSASLEEFFTMVSAGLAGSSPHMVSASITALTRILYEFHATISAQMQEDIVGTMELFLIESKNREIVRSVLGFVKVAVISLLESIMSAARMDAIVKGLVGWSKEHKSRFRAKVKHILERIGRRYGWERLEAWTPEEAKKLVHNIRKSKERVKRKKAESNDKGDDEDDEADADGGEVHGQGAKRRSKFESEFDRAVYGSGSDDSGSREDSDNGSVDEERSRARGDKGRSKGKRQGDRYIVEDEDEPLDLLDRKALGSISSTKPLRGSNLPRQRRNKATVNIDGKLVIGMDEDENGDDDADAMVIDTGNGKSSKRRDRLRDAENGDLKSGIGAYVDAIRGRDAVQRGRGGRLKFSNKRQKDDGDMDVDDGDDGADGRRSSGKGQVRRSQNGSRGGRGSMNGRGGFRRSENGDRSGDRKGIDGTRNGKIGGGRITKSFGARKAGVRRR